MVRNYVCSLESARRLYAMVEAAARTGEFVADFVIFVRPDDLFACDLDVSKILRLQPNELFVPNHAWAGGSVKPAGTGVPACIALISCCTFLFIPVLPWGSRRRSTPGSYLAASGRNRRAGRVPESHRLI